MSVKRIAVVSHYFAPHLGGIEIIARELATRLSRGGFEILWAATGTPPPTRQQGLTYLSLPACNVTERWLGVPYPVCGPIGMGVNPWDGGQPLTLDNWGHWRYDSLCYDTHQFRPIRVEYTNAVSHVTARGNEHNAIYRDRSGIRHVVERLEKKAKKTKRDRTLARHLAALVEEASTVKS